MYCTLCVFVVMYNIIQNTSSLPASSSATNYVWSKRQQLNRNPKRLNSFLCSARCSLWKERCHVHQRITKFDYFQVWQDLPFGNCSLFCLQYPHGDSSSPYVFVCENPQEIVVRFPIKGKHKICEYLFFLQNSICVLLYFHYHQIKVTFLVCPMIDMILIVWEFLFETIFFKSFIIFKAPCTHENFPFLFSVIELEVKGLPFINCSTVLTSLESYLWRGVFTFLVQIWR